MSGQGWVTKLLTAAVTESGDATQVAAGVIDTQGGAQLAFQIDGADEVILPGLESGGEHINNVREAAIEAMRRQRGTNTTRGELPFPTAARTKAGATTRVVAGVVDVRVFFQVGGGARVFLPGLQSADEHIDNVREAMAVKYALDRKRP